MSAAERQRARRERLRSEDSRQINLVLPATAFAALKRLCEVSGRNYSEQIATLLMSNRDPLVHSTPKENRAHAKAERERRKAEKAAHEERMEELRLKSALSKSGRGLPAIQPMGKDADGVFRVIKL